VSGAKTGTQDFFLNNSDFAAFIAEPTLHRKSARRAETATPNHHGMIVLNHQISL
jgi:hypothetical protein